MRNVSDAGRILRRRDGREVDDGLRTFERIERLARIGQVGHEALAVGTAVVCPIDVEDLMSGCPKVANDPASGLTGASRHDRPHDASPWPARACASPTLAILAPIAARGLVRVGGMATVCVIALLGHSTRCYSPPMPPPGTLSVRDLRRPAEDDAAVELLTDAFLDFPAMRVLVGHDDGARSRLRRLFVMEFDPSSRITVLAAELDGRVVGALTYIDSPACSSHERRPRAPLHAHRGAASRTCHAHVRPHRAGRTPSQPIATCRRSGSPRARSPGAWAGPHGGVPRTL